MRALIQRVEQASVVVAGQTVGEIAAGLLVFLGVEKNDDARVCQKLCKKVLAYRVFADEQGKMNQSICDTGGEILVVSQFTLAADTQKGSRPSFSSAAEPAIARVLYDDFVEGLKGSHLRVCEGQFAADMKVHLVNDGPVTFDLNVR